MGSSGFVMPPLQFITAATPSAMSRDSSSIQSGGHSGVAGTQCFNSLPLVGSKPSADGIRWPIWMGNANVPFEMQTTLPSRIADYGTPMKPRRRNTAVDIALEEITANRGDLWQDSKRTRQRKLQRMAKSNFKMKLGDSPMNVPCTAFGRYSKDIESTSTVCLEPKPRDL